MRQCELDDCSRKHYAKGLCRLHYKQKWTSENRGNPERYYAVSLLWKKQDYHKNPAFYIWKGTKNRARRNGIIFEIDPSDVVIPTHCPILGIPLFIGNTGFCNNSPSIDRIRPHLGYIKGNIAVISMRANRIKNDATFEEITKLQQWMNQFQ
jgi:hypothetical protein